VHVNIALAALGGEVEVPTLGGRARITLPAGVQSGKLFRLHGQGLPRSPLDPNRGDLHVRVVVETPTNLNPEQRRALEELARASGTTLDAQNGSLLQKLRSRIQGEG
jgi:molecular chaperone DnaJ